MIYYVALPFAQVEGGLIGDDVGDGVGGGLGRVDDDVAGERAVLKAIGGTQMMPAGRSVLTDNEHEWRRVKKTYVQAGQHGGVFLLSAGVAVCVHVSGGR